MHIIQRLLVFTTQQSWPLITCAAIGSMLLSAPVKAEELLPPKTLKTMKRTTLPKSVGRALTKKVLGSWKITGYHAWDKRHNEYIEIAKRRDRMNKTVETWLFRKNGTFRHIMSKNLWFTGKWQIEQGLGGQKQTQTSHDIVLAMDVSGTMRGRPIAAAQKAALELINKMSPSTRVALVTFGSKVQSFGFSSQRNVLRKRIRSLQANAMKTRLYDGLNAALKLGGSARSGRGAVVLLSDGKDEGSQTQLLDLLGQLETRKVPVHAVGYTQVEKRHLTSMKSFAKVSNGSFGSATQPQALGKLLHQTLSEFMPAPSSAYFVLKTTKVRGSMPNMRRPEDWFIGTWLDDGRDLTLYYVGTRWDRSHRNSLLQAHRFEAVRYGER